LINKRRIKYKYIGLIGGLSATDGLQEFDEAKENTVLSSGGKIVYFEGRCDSEQGMASIFRAKM
jgi:hypothetical protein